MNQMNDGLRSVFLKRLMLFWLVAGVPAYRNSSEAVTIVSPPSVTQAAKASLAATLGVNTDVPSRVSVSVTDGVESWDRNFFDYGTNHIVPLFGFKAGRTNEITVQVRDRFQNEFTAPTPLTFVTAPLPTNFPVFTVLASKPELMEPGYTLFRVDVHNNTYAYVVIVDNSGEVVWYNQTPSTAEVRQLENGDLLMPSTNRFVEMDLLGNTVKTLFVPSDLQIDPHEGLPTSHGTILYLSGSTETVTDYPTSTKDPTAPRATATIHFEKVVEISITNAALLNTWRPIDVLDPRRISYLVGKISGGWDSEHSNAVIEDPSDNSLIISMRHQNSLVKISRATGELKWILGPHDGWGPEWQHYLLNPVGTPFGWEFGQHAPVITTRGTITLFDDGNFRAMPFDAPVLDTNNYSRAVEYKIDEKAMEISQVWDYGRTNVEERIYADHEGNADPLPATGNVLINFPAVSYVNGVPPSSFGASATMVRIQEVTHDAEAQIVFDLAITMYDKTNSVYKNCSVYRAHRIPDLYGHPAAPVTDLNVQMDAGTASLQFSADPARTYSIEASSDLEQWTEITIADPEEEGIYEFTDEDSINAAHRYYRVVTH
jgi:arylsulfate sulfotransferase